MKQNLETYSYNNQDKLILIQFQIYKIYDSIGTNSFKGREYESGPFPERVFQTYQMDVCK